MENSSSKRMSNVLEVSLIELASPITRLSVFVNKPPNCNSIDSTLQTHMFKDPTFESRHFMAMNVDAFYSGRNLIDVR